jgi:hypothetical protein
MAMMFSDYLHICATLVQLSLPGQSKKTDKGKNVAGEMSLSVLKDVTMDAFSSVTRRDWEGYNSSALFAGL